MSSQFYRPYDSGTESDSESDFSEQSSDLLSDLDASDTSEYASLVSAGLEAGATVSTAPDQTSGPDFRALAGALNTSIAGPNFDSSGSDLDNRVPQLGFPISRGFPTFKGYEIPPDPSGNKMKTTTQNITSVIMLDSRDRDRKVFPQPTNLTLRLPRQYQNVTNFSMVQLKLLSSFFYFRNDKQNTDISILELNRTIVEQGKTIPNIIKSFIRQGTYDINSLLTELTTQLNVAPVFYDFPNGFQDFAPRFAATGDFSLNFNFPGDTFYDSLLDQFIPNPTMTLIISKYFQNQFAGLSSYTTDQIKIAYYYPVVKEVLLDNDYGVPLNLTLTTSTAYLLPGETARSRCIYTFQGLNDKVVQEVIENNISILDDYRVKHTFRYYLVNKYNCSYETQSNRITIAAPSLNTSLINLLNYKQAQFFAEQLSQNGLTQDSYNALSAQNTILLAVLNDMFYYIQRWLAYYFGINFNTFALNYIATPTFLVPIRDGSAVSGVSSNYDLNVITRNIQPTSNDILTPLRQPAKPYWNRMVNLPQSTLAFPLNLETGSTATSSNYPYSLLLDQQDRDHKFVDSNGYLYTNQLTRYSDIVVPLEASKYTVFQFKSPVRQTLQVETLPRPTKYRYPAYNQVAYDLSAQTLFDNSYSFVQNAQNSTMDVTAVFNTSNLKTIPGFSNARSTANFGISYASSVNLWGTNQIIAQVGDTRAYYQMRTPLPTDYLSTNAAGYRYPLSVTMTPSNGNFLTPMNFFLYHDRAAFMADISDVRNEKPIHFLASSIVTTAMSTATMTFPVYADQTYYILSRSSNTTIPTQYYRLNPWFPSGTQYSTLTSSLTGFNPLVDPQSAAALDNFNTAIVADPAYIRLPIQQSIQNSTTTDAQYSPLTLSSFAIGYDASGVSTDLTNYCGFIGTFPTSNAVPNAPLRMDPTSGYAFQVESVYNPATQNYLYSNSGNAILTPQGVGVYTPKTVTARETSIVHWYGTTYLPNSLNQPAILSNQVAATYHSPFTQTTTNAPLQGYTYGGSNQAIQFGDGVVGIGFVPQQGVWDIQRAMFKSIYTTSNAATDENLNIKYLGVYYSATTSNKFIHEIPLRDAIAVLKFSKAVTYTSTRQNLGFDAADGTYYEFERDTSYRVGSTSYLYGYSQIRSTINTDLNSIYSFIPFDQNGNFLTFQGLAGSPVPYPYYSDASAGIAYLDGTQAPAQKGLVVPSQKATPDTVRAPPTGYDQTQSKYELSMPIGTNLLQFVQPFPIVNISNAFQPFQQLPYAPSLVIADVSGYIMTQDSYFRIFEYQADTTDTSLVQKYVFTVDQVYPPTNPLINYIGVAANEREYAFFAYSNLATPSPGTSKLLIRTMTPSNGIVQETYEFNNLPDFDPTVQTITNVTYNNFGGFTLALKNGSVVSAICKHNTTTSSMTILSNADPIGFNANVDRFITRQPPKEANGNFYVFPYRYNLIGGITEGIVDFIKITPSNLIPSQDPFYKYTGVTGQQSAWGINKPCQIQVFNLSNATGAQIFAQPIVSRQPYRDDFYMLSQSAPSSFYEITSYTASNTTQYTSNAFAQESVYKFPTSASNLTQGGNGSKWSLHGDILYGNRNDTVDSPRKIGQAWQLFYPVQRIVFRQIAKNFTFMHDVSGLQYPEYPHTALIGYNTSTSMFADINRRWGLEASGNFAVADFAFAGRTFNSYVFTFPLQPNTSNTPYYYLAVRNYTPTEKSQVLMRFSLNNKYDFGYVSMADLSNEIVLSQTASNQFTPDYYAALHAYNSNFIIGSNGRIFGANVVQGYPGSNLSNVTGFGDFYARFLALYNQYNKQVQLIQNINAAVKSNVEAFIQSDLQYILPATSLNRQRFTDPLTFTILWRSALTKEYLPLEENWGLGWNLGYDKADTPYETVQRAQSFFKILDDFINLRMNPEFDMNRMDTGGKENLGQTLEPTGSTKAFHGKLLLANFGSFAQTFVSNPVSFAPPLGRLDRLSFTWVDITGATINNADCEWNAVIQLVEKKEVAEIGLPFLLDPTALAAAVKQATG